jgi:3alpha(or 20beta)-hydroxysteroid dehydrogenase
LPQSEGSKLEGRVALITGAARGTGAETARLFAAEGARVILSDVLDDLGEAAAEKIAKEIAKETGGRASYQRLDVTNEDDWQTVVDSIVREAGGIDVLVNNAALLDVSSIAETSLETLTRIVQVNQIGAFLGVRAVIEPMRARGGGSIVNVASIDAMEGSNGVAAYTSSKWGMRGLTKAAAIELGRLGIRVNTVCPGFGSSEMVEPFFKKAAERLRDRKERLPDRPQSPASRRGRLEDVARAILYLASEDSSFVSGIDLTVDGGFTVGKVEPGAPFS